MDEELVENLTMVREESGANNFNASHATVFETQIRIVGYWEFVVFLFGAPANVLVLYLTATFLRSNSKRTSSNHHQSNLWFVVSMTMADALFCFLHAPMMGLQFAFRAHYNAAACFFMYIVTHTTTICSSLSLLWLNVDKFLYLNRPLHYHRCVTRMRALAVVLCTWVLSLCWAIFFMLGPFSVHTAPCTFRPSHIYPYMAFFVCFFVLPTAVSLAISSYIAYIVVRVSKENALRRKKSSGSLVTTPSQSKSAKAIVFVFTTTLWSSFTYLPYRLAYLVYVSPGFEPSWASTAASYFLFALMATNAAGNPLITVITQRRYTTAVSHLWQSLRSASDKEKLRRRTSYSATSTLMTFQSVTSRMSSVKKCEHKLIEDPEAESAM